MSLRKYWIRAAPRVAAPASALIVFLVVALLCWRGSAVIFAVLRLWGVHPPVTDSFLDLRYIFADAECWRKGIDVYLSDPCDPLGRLLGYSPLWLRLAFLPSQAWTPVFGAIIDVLFLMSLAAFPPPQRRGEFLISLAATLSPPVAFALQRANVDVIIFMMVLAAAGLWIGSLRQRALSYAIISLAGLLKFYPLVLLALAVRERIKIATAIFVAGGFLLFGFAAYFYRELIEMSHNIPTGSYFVGDMFGAKNFPDGLVLGHGYAPNSWLGALPWLALLALFAAQVFIAARWLDLRRELAGIGALDRALLLSGSAIICGCFFAGQNAGYRGIFLLLTVPGWLALWRQSTARRVQHFAKWACFLTLFLLWQGVLTWNENFLAALQVWFGPGLGSALWSGLWATRELAWWLAAGILASVVMCYAVECQTAAWLRQFVNRHLSAEIQ